jgi:hypothetical protein
MFDVTKLETAVEFCMKTQASTAAEVCEIAVCGRRVFLVNLAKSNSAMALSIVRNRTTNLKSYFIDHRILAA